MLSIALLCTITAGVTAPDTLTFVEARALTRERNPAVRAAREAVARARHEASQAAALQDPTVTIGREQTGATIWQNVILLEQPLELFGSRRARRRAAQAAVEVAERQFSVVVAAAEAEVAAAYAAAQAARRQALLAGRLEAAFARAVRMIEARRAAGDASGYEARRLELEAARAAGARAEAVARHRAAVATLATLLGRDPGVELTPGDDDPRVVSLVPDRDSVAARAARAAGEVRVAAAMAQAAEAEAARVRQSRIPIPSLSVGYKEERIGPSKNLGGYVAQISLPLPAWGSRGAAAAAAAREASRQSALAEAAALAVRREALALVDQASLLGLRLAALAPQLGPEADRALAAADAAFAAGEMALIEWLDAIRAYHAASVEQATLIAEHITVTAELERITGLPLLAR